MTNPRILPPKKDHFLNMCVLAFATFALIVFLFYIMEGGLNARYLAGLIPVFALLELGFFSRLGRHVIVDVDAQNISKPMIIKRMGCRVFSTRDLLSFERVYNINDISATIGVIIHPKEGGNIRYSDRRTPGCTQELLQMLEKNRIPEKYSPRKILG